MVSEPDTSPPTGSITINNDDTYTNSRTVLLNLTASDDAGEDGMRMLISNANDFSGSTYEAFFAARVWMLAAGNDVKTVYVRFKDASGNESEEYSDSIILDSSLPGPPGPPDLAAADDTGVSDSDNLTMKTTGLTISGTSAELGTAVQLYDSPSSFLGSAPVDSLGTWSVDISLQEGVHYVFARTMDEAGNASLSSAPLVVTVDTTPAAAPNLLKPTPGENTGTNRRPLFIWSSVAEASAYELQADDSSGFASVDYDWTNLSGTSYTPAVDMNGSASAPVGTRYYLRIRTIDAAGNIGGWSNAKCVNVGRFDSDFNGDGYADAIVGAWAYNSNEGRAYIYLGGASPDNTADLTLTAEAAGNRFGVSVASAGDVNGDGYADAIVGAWGAGPAGQGRAYIYLGGSSMDNAADVTLTGEALLNEFGYNVASAGDVNGDGYGDIIVGANGYNSHQGRAYIFLGGSSPDNAADLTMTGEATFDIFGCSVASAGDVNGDGYADIIVGANAYGSGQGRAYIYLGGASLDNTADLIMTGVATDGLGVSVASAGDVNGDGYADTIVGAPGYSLTPGRAYIYLGGSSPDNSADLTLTGETAGNAFGVSVASAGDVNGDGYADSVVGAYSYSSNQGRAYIYLGGSSPDNTADLTLAGEAASNYFGASVSPAGDVNGDGFADVAVGANGYNSYQGRAYIYLGGSSPDNTADLILAGEATGNQFGYSVAWAGECQYPPIGEIIEGVFEERKALILIASS